MPGESAERAARNVRNPPNSDITGNIHRQPAVIVGPWQITGGDGNDPKRAVIVVRPSIAGGNQPPRLARGDRSANVADNGLLHIGHRAQHIGERVHEIHALSQGLLGVRASRHVPHFVAGELADG